MITGSAPMVCGGCGVACQTIHVLLSSDGSPIRAVLGCGYCDPGGWRIDLDDWTSGRLDEPPDDEGNRPTTRELLLAKGDDATVGVVDAVIDGRSANTFVEVPEDPFAAYSPEPTAVRSSVVTLAEFLAAPRESVEPFVTSEDGRSVMLAADSTLVVAGAPDAGKSLVLLDLVGRLADDRPSVWLGLNVVGELRVLNIVYEGEGSDEDVRERLAQLVPSSVADRLMIWDRWRHDRPPRATDEDIDRLAAHIKTYEIDVVALDTLPGFLAGTYSSAHGIPEEAYQWVAAIRARVGRPVAFVVVLHTRKVDRQKGLPADELEEVAGTFIKKADAAVVIRKDGDQNTPRRKVTFAKCRRGPKPDPLIATFPTRDDGDDAPPRLVPIATAGGQPIKGGTDAATIVAWIRGHDEPVSVAAICNHFDISDTTLRQRRVEGLVGFGLAAGRIAGHGRPTGWGTPQQWKRLAERTMGVVEQGDEPC